ncbi:MAG: hypothetical protein QNK37_13175 [Acidobacteriota bacterium]|nr:hypothetical protein [Acidobacteriota bacterium]
MLKKVFLTLSLSTLLLAGFAQLAFAMDECHMSCQQEAAACIQSCRQHFNPAQRGECWYECRVDQGICNQACP